VGDEKTGRVEVRDDFARVRAGTRFLVEVDVDDPFAEFVLADVNDEHRVARSDFLEFEKFIVI